MVKWQGCLAVSLLTLTTPKTFTADHVYHNINSAHNIIITSIGEGVFFVRDRTNTVP